METFGVRVRQVIQAAIVRAGGINALGRIVGVNGSSVLAWTRGEAFPGLDKVPVLAVLLGEEQNALRGILVGALEERAVGRRIRPTMGGGSSGSLPLKPLALPQAVASTPRRSPKKASDNGRSRRRAAGMLAGLGLGLAALGNVSRADAEVLRNYASSLKDSVELRRKAA